MEKCRAFGCTLKKSRSVSGKLHGHGVSQLSVVEGMKKTFDVNITPGRNVCSDCFSSISKVTVLSEKVPETRQELSSQKRKLTDWAVQERSICHFYTFICCQENVFFTKENKYTKKS